MARKIIRVGMLILAVRAVMRPAIRRDWHERDRFGDRIDANLRRYGERFGEELCSRMERVAQALPEKQTSRAQWEDGGAGRKVGRAQGLSWLVGRHAGLRNGAQ